jgi:YidC/Oxa1 family membrane protein insertase
MHDLEIRLTSTLLFSGGLLFIAFLFYSLLYPQKLAATPTNTPAASASHAPDYGYLAPVARPIEWTLRQIQSRVTHRSGQSSWGWAIVVATCLLNLLLLPFRILAARNARAMRALKPEVDAINAQYKTGGAMARLQMNPEQSQAISALYRKHQVNPASGCIPSIAPLVILAPFYSVLNKLTELHGAHWLWISDLSRPEQLPLRILPVLMVASQLFLGRITPNPAADPNTNRMMMVMTLVSGVIFYGQPSALLLYWLTSNLLAVAQQTWLNRRYA